MSRSRRDFIKATALGAAVAATGLPGVSAAGETHNKDRAPQPFDILILGGTGFIGPHMVREALRRGHAVTLFNRGRSNNALFPDIETIKGDRDNGLDGLKGRRWDAVIDNSGYVPRHVQDSARLLSPNCDRYVYISTVAVYADIPSATDEDSPLATIDDETVEEVTRETYGPLKALCERRAAEEIDASRLAILRPTYICGPGDHTDRFSYWPIRTRNGGEMLWPGTPDDALQIVDVRDLANFTIDCVDREISGTYNMGCRGFRQGTGPHPGRAAADMAGRAGRLRRQCETCAGRRYADAPRTRNSQGSPDLVGHVTRGATREPESWSVRRERSRSSRGLEGALEVRRLVDVELDLLAGALRQLGHCRLQHLDMLGFLVAQLGEEFADLGILDAG